MKTNLAKWVGRILSIPLLVVFAFIVFLTLVTVGYAVIHWFDWVITTIF